jgi:hypothetical protein
MMIFPLHRSNPLAWALLPAVLDRVRAFRATYEHFGDVERLCRVIEAHFLVDDPDVMLIVGWDGARVVGHALLTLDEWLGDKFVTIQQYEWDAALPRAEVRAHLARIEEWARRKGAGQIRVVAEGPVRERAYRAFYGFEGGKTLMSRKVKEAQDA